ncbi:MAG: hypothetical protein GTO53_02380 [Planctomycetales bacterium]|nr:hypothetical protein [Planctomycetales bacterium]NIM08015.1 hypothetical protein [Planctomycetales bacterium]NIN07497.1 hypothetical protein [Planctomycetales bacterium]NIN76601.1 hypothetical protein [Planctomycetales bacterium]NIO33791.1 hypothetical protein [Planctomycetales bacterium]
MTIKQLNGRTIRVDVAPGEVIDKITILEIKQQRISDRAKQRNVTTELNVLNEALRRHIESSHQLQQIQAALRDVNGQLWDIEDEIRVCERDKNFGPKFIQLARAVYQTNDRRAALKREINELLGSAIIEEKDYQDYSSPDSSSTPSN